MRALRFLRVAAGFAAFSWLAFAPAFAQAPPKYQAELLGAAINASAMNSSGQVIGTTNGSSGNLRGWIASSGSPLTELPLPPGRISSYANDITDQGLIAGAVGSAYSPEFSGVAAAWYPNGSGGYTVVELGKLPGHVGSNATALNDAGDIVGWSSNGTYRWPVLFTAPSGILDLTSTGIFDPHAINEKRVVADSSFTVKLLDLNTMAVTDLGVPTGYPSNYLATSAAAINESNQVAGLAILTTSTSCDRQAARHTPGIGWKIFSSCGKYNGAVDINDLGDVVMQLNLYPHVRFQGLGTFRIEDLIDAPVGHWYVINGYGLAINNARQMAVPATNQVTGQSGMLLLTPENAVGTPLCWGDGATLPCPCGNASAPGSGQGCLHSGAVGAVLKGSGSAIVANDDLVLHVTQGPANRIAMLIQGATSISMPFNDGILCAGSPIVRLQSVVLDSSGAAS
ncbi:MAG TPA: hypothetical protein VMS76_04410, partial [Planctomycetota bacterium]|nr:hypothetical protein [Planctomycetota bacterium]